MTPNAYVEYDDQNGHWFLKWHDGDLYWVQIDLEVTDRADKGGAVEAARTWLHTYTHLEVPA